MCHNISSNLRHWNCPNCQNSFHSKSLSCPDSLTRLVTAGTSPGCQGLSCRQKRPAVCSSSNPLMKPLLWWDWMGVTAAREHRQKVRKFCLIFVDLFEWDICLQGLWASSDSIQQVACECIVDWINSQIYHLQQFIGHVSFCKWVFSELHYTCNMTINVLQFGKRIRKKTWFLSIRACNFHTNDLFNSS